MKMMMMILLFLSGACVSAPARQIVSYPVPNELLYARHADDFTVTVRVPGGEWQDLYEYKVTVDMDNPQIATMVQFDFGGTVEVRVKLNNGIPRDVKIRPRAAGIAHEVRDNAIFFTLADPVKLSVEVNGDRLHNLHLFANPLETETYTSNQPGVVVFKPGLHVPDGGVIYFGPGLHVPDGGVIRVASNTTVYLAPGAVVKGKFVCDHVENVRVVGRGFLLEPHRGFEVTNSRNITIDGITIINPTHYTIYGGAVEGLHVNNIKAFSAKGWGDGIDMMSCSNVDITDVFLRTSDDCIAIYGHRWDYRGDARGYRIANVILWADITHPINIGIHGDAAGSGEVIENISFRDVDILEHDEDDRNYQGCIAFSVGDKNLVRDVVFEDVRVENIQEGQLVNLRVLYNEKYSAAPGRGIERVHFKNIFYEGTGENSSIIAGYDAGHVVRDVLFENIVIRGVRVKSFEEANIKVGAFTERVTIK